MSVNTDTEKVLTGWDRNSWLWVFFCIIAIYSTIPLARKLQQVVYTTVGKEFFTYLVFFIIIAVVTALLYHFAFRLKIKNASQYIWLFLCAGSCIYFTIHLRQNPEEAIHILEYGLLSILIFRALSRRIQDRTVYITAVLLAVFFGILDEFIQWMMPERFWGMKDVGINTIGAVIFQIALWKGIKPSIICKPVKKISVMLLMGIATLDIIFLGLCLSNTPDTVKRYTSLSDTLRWLRDEEPMAEFGYRHSSSEVGVFFSRFSLKELNNIDLNRGNIYGQIISGEIHSQKTVKDLLELYTPYTNTFLYEFLLHISQRDKKLKKFREAANHDPKAEAGNTAYRENLILEKYFGNTLKHAKLAWSDTQRRDVYVPADVQTGHYVSKTGGKIITTFNLKTAWSVITVVLFFIWISGVFRIKKLKNRYS